MYKITDDVMMKVLFLTVKHKGHYHSNGPVL